MARWEWIGRRTKLSSTMRSPWAPDGITWYVDGREVHRTRTLDDIPSETQKIFASIWGSETLTDWMGRFDPAAVPQVLDIDWIAYTRLDEACRFPASILCEGGS